jgi:hypothetical protein
MSKDSAVWRCDEERGKSSDEHECGRMARKRSTKRRWNDCVKQDMREMAVSDEMTSDRGE